MSERFKLRETAVPLLLAQRTEYGSAVGDLGEAFFSDMKAEFDELTPHLPGTAATILDIGGGLGAIDVFLIEQYRACDPQLYLLDRDEVSPHIEYFFSETPSAYNSFAEARGFLVDNGVNDRRITTVDILRDGFPRSIRPDIVVSLLAWGYHFSVGAYLEDVLAVLSEQGRLIIDLRKGTDGLSEIMSAFRDVTLIRETFRQIRVVAFR